jgi:hypothetical protein
MHACVSSDRVVVSRVVHARTHGHGAAALSSCCLRRPTCYLLVAVGERTGATAADVLPSGVAGLMISELSKMVKQVCVSQTDIRKS